MVLSDRTIREEIAKKRIIIEPLDQGCIQPASIDVHLDKKLRVFRTWRYPFYIDVKQNLDGLGSKYQGQQEPTPSRYYQDFEEESR